MINRILYFTLCMAVLMPLMVFAPAIPFAMAQEQAEDAETQDGAQDGVVSEAQDDEPSEADVIKAISAEVDEQVKQAAEDRDASVERTFSLLNVIVEKLNEREQQHFFLSYTNYNLLETFDVVQKDVGNAIKACGENNPEMKKALEDRFKAWGEGLNPIAKEARANLDNMILAQEYASQADMRELFASIDDAREKTNASIQKVPVTSPESCQYLLDKMDETQQSMESLLRTTLITFPQAFPEGGVEQVPPMPTGDDEPDDKASADKATNAKASDDADGESE